MPRNMKALFKRCKSRIQNLDGPQEPSVLHNKSEAESKASKMGLVPVQIH